MDFLQKPLVWFSKIYLSVQSKNCGRNSFFLFFFSEIFRIFEQNIFRLWPKNFNNLSKLPSVRPEEHFLNLIFFKVLNRFGFSAETFGMVLKNLSKCPEWKLRKNFFFVFFPEFFRFLSKNFSDFWPKNFKNLSKLPSTCPEEQFVAWIFFLKFWIVLDFLQKPLAWFSNFYLRVQSKNCGRNSFLIFLFRTFSDFESKIFQTFGQKTSRSCQNYLLRVQRNILWL